MQKVELGKTGLRVSPLGIGTGTSSFSGRVFQSEVPPREFAEVVLHAYDLGINFWDTAYTYGTYAALAEALKQLRRTDVVIMTKFTTPSYRRTRYEIEDTLRSLGTDYLDICLLHGLRNRFEYRMRRPALQALLEAQEKGCIGTVGLSSHGIGALEVALEDPRMQVVLARVNVAGVAMDSYRENFISKLVAIPAVQRGVLRMIPKRVMPSLSAKIEPPRLNEVEQELVKTTLKKFKAAGKPVVAMKILGAGALTGQFARCIGYVKGLDYVSAMVIGMVSKGDVERSVKAYQASDPSAGPEPSTGPSVQHSI